MVSFVFAPTSAWARVTTGAWVTAESRCLRGVARRAEPLTALPSTAIHGQVRPPGAQGHRPQRAAGSSRGVRPGHCRRGPFLNRPAHPGHRWASRRLVDASTPMAGPGGYSAGPCFRRPAHLPAAHLRHRPAKLVQVGPRGTCTQHPVLSAFRSAKALLRIHDRSVHAESSGKLRNQRFVGTRPPPPPKPPSPGVTPRSHIHAKEDNDPSAPTAMCELPGESDCFLHITSWELLEDVLPGKSG